MTLSSDVAEESASSTYSLSIKQLSWKRKQEKQVSRFFLLHY